MQLISWVTLTVLARILGILSFWATSTNANHLSQQCRPFGLRGGSDHSRGATHTTARTSVASLIGILQFGDNTDALSWLVGENATSLSAVLLDEQGSPISQMSRLPVDPMAMQAVALLSDIIVIAVPQKWEESSWDEMVKILLEISREQEARGLSQKKCHLVILSNAAKEPAWIEEVVQTKLQRILPTFWESFELLTHEKFRAQWGTESQTRDLRNFVKEMLPYENNVRALSELVRRVYETFNESKVDNSSSLFRVENYMVPAVAATIPSVMNKAEDQGRTTSQYVKEFRKEDPQDLVQRVLSESQSKLSVLEIEMQQVLLDSQATNQVPLLDFGGKANGILVEAYQQLDGFPPTMSQGFMTKLLGETHQLYKDQLEALRNYYGRRYEASLDQEPDETVWAATAHHLTKGFRAAAAHAVPDMCKPNGALFKMFPFDCTQALQGLINDMLEATQLRKDEQSLAFDEDDDEENEDVTGMSRRRFPPWVKKVTSRAIALGINYVQGWLAWQALKRAALERDREMPKFPLF